MKLGVSAYFNLPDHNIPKTRDFLSMAKRLGMELVFTSCHIPEAENDGDFEELLKIFEELDLKVIIDVSKPMMNRFILPPNTYALRLDWGFSHEDIIDLLSQYSCYIELNAATLSIPYLMELKSRGVDLKRFRVSYNFYPKKYTGLSLDTVIRKTALFKSLGLTVMAYLPSQVGKRPPLCLGLPTVENHRNLDIEIAYYELLLSGVDEVIIGDSYPSEEELTTLVKASQNLITIPINLYSDLFKSQEVVYQLLASEQRSRSDQSPYMVRSSKRSNIPIAPFNTVAVSPYQVTIDNANNRRYQGEIGIALQPMPAQIGVNVIGEVDPSAHNLVNLLPPGSKFRFKISYQPNQIKKPSPKGDQYIICVDSGGSKTDIYAYRFDPNSFYDTSNLNPDDYIIFRYSGLVGSPAVDKTAVNNILSGINLVYHEVSKKLSNYQLVFIQLGISGIGAISNIDGFKTAVLKQVDEQISLEQISLVDDGVIAMHSVIKTTDYPCLVVSSGTGLVIYGNDQKQLIMAGGWGHLLGEKGSAFSTIHQISLEIIDHFEAKQALTEFELKFLKLINAHNVYQIKAIFYQGNKGDIAKYCVDIIKWAHQGDQDAKRFLSNQGKYLAKQVIELNNRLNFEQVPIIGLRGSFFKDNPDTINAFKKTLVESGIDYLVDQTYVLSIHGAYYYAIKQLRDNYE